MSIPSEPPPIGGITPQPPSEPHAALKSDARKLRAKAMKSPAPSSSSKGLDSLPDSGSKAGRLFSILLGSSEEAADQTADGTSMTLLKNLKSAFSQIPE